MRYKNALVIMVGLALVVFWTGLVTPRFGPPGSQGTLINSRVVEVWIAGWVVILVVVLALLNLTKRK